MAVEFRSSRAQWSRVVRSQWAGTGPTRFVVFPVEMRLSESAHRSDRSVALGT